jgi:hypothetical protein
MSEEVEHSVEAAPVVVVDKAALEGYLQLRASLKRRKWTKEYTEQPSHVQKTFKQYNVNGQGKKEKKKKRPRYPGEPVRPPNSWQLFCKAYDHLLAKKKAADAKAGVKGAANTLQFFQPLYAETSEKEKQKYNEQAAELMREYNRKMDEFFATHKQYLDDRKKSTNGKPKGEGKAVSKPAAKKKVKGETSAAKIVKREAAKKAAVPEADEGEEIEY